MTDVKREPAPLEAAAAQLRLAREYLTAPTAANFPHVATHLAGSAEALREFRRRMKPGDRKLLEGFEGFRRELALTRKLLESAGGIWLGLAEIHWPRASAYDREGRAQPAPAASRTLVEG